MVNAFLSYFFQSGYPFPTIDEWCWFYRMCDNVNSVSLDYVFEMLDLSGVPYFPDGFPDGVPDVPDNVITNLFD